jgi:hypothetical protein
MVMNRELTKIPTTACASSFLAKRSDLTSDQLFEKLLNSFQCHMHHSSFSRRELSLLDSICAMPSASVSEQTVSID